MKPQQKFWEESSKDIQTVEPPFQQRNNLYVKWLSSEFPRDKEEFARGRRDTWRAVRNAKNAWFLSKAQEAEQGRFGAKEVWQCIRDMQRACRRLLCVTSGTIRDEAGNPCLSAEEKQQCWRQHFTAVLNQQSHLTLKNW